MCAVLFRGSTRFLFLLSAFCSRSSTVSRIPYLSIRLSIYLSIYLSIFLPLVVSVSRVFLGGDGGDPGHRF